MLYRVDAERESRFEAGLILVVVVRIPVYETAPALAIIENVELRSHSRSKECAMLLERVPKLSESFEG